MKTSSNATRNQILADLPGSGDDESGYAREMAAKATGAAGRTVQQAKAVLRDASDLAEEVRAGRMALDAAD